jgi:hypothetical protein
MSETGLTVPCMTELPRRYDITITVDRDDGGSLDPAEFAVVAERAASARAASIVSAHTASHIVSVVTVLVERPCAAKMRPEEPGGGRPPKVIGIRQRNQD